MVRTNEPIQEPGTDQSNRNSPRERPAGASPIVPANSGEHPAIRPANTPLTLEAALGEIAEHEAGLSRDAFPASRLRVEADRVIAGDREFHLGAEGLRRLCKRLRAPAEYVATFKPELRARILQDHFAEGRFVASRLTDRNSCVVSRDGEFLDLGRYDLLTLDNSSVVEALRDGVGDDAVVLEVQNLHVDDEAFTIDVVSPRVAEEVRPGDILRGGVHVTHSHLDGQATEVLAYVIRLVCLNGLVQRQCLGKKRGSTPRTRRMPASRTQAREMQRAQVQKLVTDAWSKLGEKMAAIRRLRDKAVEVRPSLERFLRQGHLFSRGLMGRLTRAWEEEGGEPSAFGALNAMTRVATHSTDLAPWQRRRLARLAGVYANQELHLCPHCFSVLAS